MEKTVETKHVFLIQSTNQPDPNFITLSLAVDAARRASAKEIIVVIPYFSYSRQERKSLPRAPISARIFATFLETLGVNRVLTMDLHAKAIEGFFLKTNVDHLYSSGKFIKVLNNDYKNEIDNEEIVIVTPDIGAANNARNFAVKFLNTQHLAIISKGRDKANSVSSMELVGDVKNKIAIIVDDIADTCGTIINAAKLLREKVAKSVIAVVTHKILSGDAREKIDKSEIDKIYFSDTIEKNNLPRKAVVVSMSNLFGEVIKRVANGESVSDIF